MQLPQSVEIVFNLAASEFKKKYSESTLGYIWSVLTPLLMLATLYIVFTLLINFRVKDYQLFLLIGIILYNYFSEATTEGLNSITHHRDLVKKINIKKEILVVSSCVVSTAYLLINILVYFGFLIFFGVRPTFNYLYFIITLIEMFMISLGLGFALSALSSRHGDVKYVWSFILILMFWLTPIFYDYNLIAPQYRKYYLLNPLARIITTAREVFINNHVPLLDGIVGLKHEGITLLMSLSLFAFGYLIFRKYSPYFAEML